MYSIQRIATDDFLAQVQSFIVHDGHVVRIPTNRTAHMKHQFWHKEQHGRHLVRHTFSRMEMTGIECYDFLILCRIADVEVVRSYRIAFQTDTEHFRFDTILHVLIFGSEDLVERILQQGTVLHAIHGNVLATVVHPKIHDTRVALTLPHFFSHRTTTLGMFYPKASDTFVRMGQRQVARLGMREGGGVEVELHSLFGCPLHPAFKMSRFHLVTIHKLTAEITIYFVQVQAMLTGYQRSRLQHIGTEFVDIACLARIVSRCLDAASQFPSRFEAGHIIRLPAMQRQLYSLQLLHYHFHIDTDSRITFHSQSVCLTNILFVHRFPYLRVTNL